MEHAVICPGVLLAVLLETGDQFRKHFYGKEIPLMKTERTQFDSLLAECKVNPITLDISNQKALQQMESQHNVPS